MLPHSRKPSRERSREHTEDSSDFSRYRKKRKPSRSLSRNSSRHKRGLTSRDGAFEKRLSALEQGLSAILQKLSRPSTGPSPLQNVDGSSTDITTQERNDATLRDDSSAVAIVYGTNPTQEAQDFQLNTEIAHSITSNTQTSNIEVLDQDAEVTVPDFKLDLLGDDNADSSLGPPVHELIVEKWSPILSNGLATESKEILLKKYPVPQNLRVAKAPVLNVEIRHAIPASASKRDEYQFFNQRVIEALIAVLATLTSELLKPEENWDSKCILELASDAGRISAQIQHHVSKTRRALITPMLTLLAKNALDSSPIDETLFGEQFLTKLKETSPAGVIVKSLKRPTSLLL